jgi:glycosyltransferase involved in cell wall biosynthesis
MNHICQISSVHSTTDTRVFFKECRSLAGAGYKVTLIARDDGEERTVDGVHIVPFHLYRNRFKRILFSPVRMLRQALKQKAELYHFHDPELIIVGLLLKLAGKKVIYDVHEDFPKQILDKSYLKVRFVRPVLAGIVRVVEAFGALFFNRIIAATPAIAANFKESKTTQVHNLPLLTMTRSDVTLDVKKEKPVIVYVGVLSQARGLKQMIQAMEYVGDRAEMWLVGKWERQDIYEECKALEGWKYVRFFGQKPQKEAYAFMRMGDMGIVNFLPIANHVNALPNKIFEYMSLGLPVVISDFPYWRENFEVNALFADPFKPEEVAERINRYLDNPQLMKEKGQNGKDKIDSGFSWEREEKILVDLYRQLLKPESKN